MVTMHASPRLFVYEIAAAATGADICVVAVSCSQRCTFAVQLAARVRFKLQSACCFDSTSIIFSFPSPYTVPV
jgi:hypothetical protein